MSLENVHTGDTVILTTNLSRDRRVVVIDRETKTQLIVGDMKFQRRTGYKVGRGTGGLDNMSIRPPREGEAERVRHENRANALRRRITQLSVGRAMQNLPLSSLERIYTLWKAEYANLENDQS